MNWNIDSRDEHAHRSYRNRTFHSVYPQRDLRIRIVYDLL